MRRPTLIILLFIIALALFFFFTGEYGLGTRAQETDNNVTDETNEAINNDIDDSHESDTENQETEEEMNNDESISDDEEAIPDDNNDETAGEASSEDSIEIEVPIPGAEAFYEDAKLVDEPESITALVNKKNVLTSDYEPDDLVKLPIHAPGRKDIETYIRQEASDAVVELVNAAQEEAELEILPASAYRSYETQRIIFQNNVNSKGSIEKANKTSALPGQSEHQTGLAVDMSCSSVGFQIKNAFGETEEAKWLAENAYRFGFIIRYPEGKTDITGYSYEPWHLRYVGKEVAEEIFDNEWTLEEYTENSL